LTEKSLVLCDKCAFNIAGWYSRSMRDDRLSQRLCGCLLSSWMCCRAVW